MGRLKKNISEPCCYHITHRCQERRFLLRFHIDCDNYHDATISETLLTYSKQRNPLWTESLAVGDYEWIEKLKKIP